jgi:hypothetical protein
MVFGGFWPADYGHPSHDDVPDRVDPGQLADTHDVGPRVEQDRARSSRLPALERVVAHLDLVAEELDPLRPPPPPQLEQAQPDPVLVRPPFPDTAAVEQRVRDLLDRQRPFGLDGAWSRTFRKNPRASSSRRELAARNATRIASRLIAKDVLCTG